MKKYFIFLVLIVFVIIISGCSKIQQTKSDNVDTQKEWEEKIPQIENLLTSADMSVEEKKEMIKKLSSEGKNLSIDDWPIYTNDELNFSIKYPKDWYYKRDVVAEKEIGSMLFVGFSSNNDIFDGTRPYPVELIIMPKGEKYNVEKEFFKRNIITSVFTDSKIGIIYITGYDDTGNIVNVNAMAKFLNKEY